MATYRQFAFLISPPWLREFWGRRLVGGAIGLQFDLLAEGAAQALKAPLLRSNSSPSDALPSIGDERLMARYPADSDATYRSRLAEAWETWLYAGNEDGRASDPPTTLTVDTARGIVGQYAAAGVVDGLGNVEAFILPAVNSEQSSTRPAWAFEAYPVVQILLGGIRFDSISSSTSGTNPEIVKTTQGTFQDAGIPDGPGKLWFDTASNGRQYVRYSSIESGSRIIVDTAQPGDDSFDLVDEGPTAVTFDLTNWSRFVVIVDEHEPFCQGGPEYGTTSNVYGDGSVYGLSATADEIATLKTIAQDWKAAHTVNPEILIVCEGPFYGEPGISYGDVGLSYNASAATVRIPNET